MNRMKSRVSTEELKVGTWVKVKYLVTFDFPDFVCSSKHLVAVPVKHLQKPVLQL